MKHEHLTDDEVDIELARLRGSKYVKLARKEMRIKYAQRQALYTLRSLEKRGMQLEDQGITLDNMESTLFSEAYMDEED